MSEFKSLFESHRFQRLNSLQISHAFDLCVLRPDLSNFYFTYAKRDAIPGKTLFFLHKISRGPFELASTHGQHTDCNLLHTVLRVRVFRSRRSSAFPRDVYLSPLRFWLQECRSAVGFSVLEQWEQRGLLVTTRSRCVFC